MKTISLDKYGPIISDKIKGEEIYNLLVQATKDNSSTVEVDLKSIKSMATFNAKQIFGRLYISLGAEKFFQKIRLSNTSDDVKLIIKIGIQNALEDNM